ncbi:MAG TPA: branched-chain amino acid transaminase [Planctomycetota bacterium]|nr:branched-chain amino acid transaminase [Planctomycetota bacterium]
MPTFDPVPESYQVPFTWLDGEAVPSAQAVVPVMTHTLHYGLGVFEGIRAYDGTNGSAVFRLREHIERLQRSAAMCHIHLPFAVDALGAACTQTLQKNKLAAGYVRPMAFVDDGSRGLGAGNNRIRVAIVVWPWGHYLGEDGMQRGIRAQVSSTVRMSARSFLPKGKINGQYVNSILAKRAARHAGYEEAILLDEAGDVAEATGENLFVVRRGTLITPPLSQPILAGITRDSVLTFAHALGLEAREERFARDTLYTADEVFLTGTAAEITPVREIDGHVIGNGARGPVTERLQATFFDAVRGRMPEYSHWLTPYRP